ncbi:hypothetical protein EB796_003365 [Bugula neritina]|uniref:Mab-21-like HhH/H2TH-like domain-containing protein n=1 Tax=Bugula neritina TaxID=10212 RepID=A0A7J7KKY0_BUGNE|nr:hypothetical protein EB796_003365 [Bugula neritina]
MKVIKNHHPQMGMFASYFYKNVLFMLDARNPTASWGRADLANRFIDMINLIHQVLSDRSLPLHFNSKVNYLASESPTSISTVANYLGDIIKKGNYSSLLDRVP